MQVGGILLIDSRAAGALFAVPCITPRIMLAMPTSCVLCSATSCVLCCAAARRPAGLASLLARASIGASPVLCRPA